MFFPLRRTAPFVILIATAVLFAGLAVVGQPARSADQPRPKEYVTGWLPYWNIQQSTASVAANAKLFKDASPFVFDADGTTQITLKADADEWRQMRRKLQIAGVANVPTVATDLSADQFARIIKNKDRRAAHARALAKVVDRYNLDGLDLDYEAINFGSSTARATVRRYYPALIRDLDPSSRTVWVPSRR